MRIFIIGFLRTCIIPFCLLYVVPSYCIQCNKTGPDSWQEKDHNLDRERYIGEWYVVNCTLENNKANVSLWKEVKEKKIVVPDQHKVTQLKQVFNITNLTFTDRGKYYCSACNIKEKSAGSLYISREGNVHQRPKILNMSLQRNVPYGSDFSMDCEIAGFYEMQWYKDGSPIESKDKKYSKKKRHITKQRLRIERFTEDDVGLYKCEAERKHVNWKKTDQVFLKLGKDGFWRLKPEIKKEPRFETAGDNISLICKSNGSVKMVWIRNDQIQFIRVTPVMEHGFNVTKKTLEINNFSKQDEGIYECHVRKLDWNRTAKFDITIKVKPKIEKGDPNKAITFKKAMELKCQLSTKTVPQSTMSWDKCVCGGDCSECKWSKLTQNTSFLTQTDSKMVSTLTIKQQTSERMAYQCTAKSEFGSDQRKWIVVEGVAETDNELYLAMILCVTFSLLFFLLIITLVLCRRKQRYGGFYICTAPPLIDFIAKFDGEKSLNEQFSNLPYMWEWEFPRERVHLGENIGKGTFGRVFLADIVGISAFQPRTILEDKSKLNRFSVFRKRKRYSHLYSNVISKAAVKMLNDNWSECDLSDFLTELKQLIHVGQHKNVVNILGACTKGRRGNAWIIMEYCEHGNLSTFLKGKRMDFEVGWLPLSEDQDISFSDFAAISLQVACGMEFLVSRKIPGKKKIIT